MENLRFSTSTYCPYCERAKLAMENKGIIGVEIINIDTDPDMWDYLIEKGGKKQVPCSFIGDQVMYEFQDIINHLESHC